MSIRNFSQGGVAMSNSIISMDQTASATTVNVCPFNSLGANANMLANQAAMNAAGVAADSSDMSVGQTSASLPQVLAGITGLVAVVPNYSGGNPPDGAKFTDGVHVYAAPKGGTAAGSGMTFLVGPTNDSPDRSTQYVMLPTPLGHTDTIYMTEPPAGSAPSNAFNQGLN